MARLCLCLNQVARFRNMNKARTPDPVSIAVAAEMAGIDGVIVHLREDRSDITDRDITVLKEVIQTHLNLAIPMNEDMIKKALKWLPDMVTLLPSSADFKTVNSLDAAGNLAYLEETVQTLRAHNIIVNMLIDIEPQQIRAAARAQTDFIQFNTAAFAAVEDLGTLGDMLQQLKSASIAANKIGMGISIGRGLNPQLVKEMLDLQLIEEYNIGWSIISRAMLVGVEKAVTDFKKILG